MPKNLYQQLGKRAGDLLLASLLIVLLCPVMLVVAILVRLVHGGPVLYQQVRAGYLGKPFRIHKFRTMSEARDAEGNLLSDEQRLTRFGKFLRSSSLDELPELWNVLRGEMSLVGPRPLLMQYLELYSDEQSRRHEVKPGVTGLAQVRGRNAISWEERFAYDVQYVKEHSPRLDAQILIETVYCVFRREGISAEDHATYPLFLGSTKDPIVTAQRKAA